MGNITIPLNDLKELEFNYKNYVFDIIGVIDENNDESYYKVDKGYIDEKTGNIYIFKESDFKFNDYPIIKFIDGKLTKIKSGIKSINSEFNINKTENIRDYSLNYIIANSDENDILYDKQALDDINSATTIFKPIINDEDDSLKKITKKAILFKNVNINKYKHKMTKRYNLTNLVSNIKGPNSLTYRSFNIWTELLGLSHLMFVKDNNTDKENPLDKIIFYNSDNNKVEELNPDDIEIYVKGKKIL